MIRRESVRDAIDRLQGAIDLLNQALLDRSQRAAPPRKAVDYCYEAVVQITAAINELESPHDD